jgi:hypothetical protein
MLPGGWTIGAIEQEGKLFLSAKGEPGEGYFIVMPFVFLRTINQILLTSEEGPVFPCDLLFIPTFERA